MQDGWGSEMPDTPTPVRTGSTPIMVIDDSEDNTQCEHPHSKKRTKKSSQKSTPRKKLAIHTNTSMVKVEMETVRDKGKSSCSHVYLITKNC